MPIGYERDDVRRRIVAIGEGSFRMEDVLEIFARMRVEGIWNYGAIYDVRLMVGHPTVSDLRRALEAAGQPAPDDQQSGPIAVVATEPTMYGMACAYAAMGPPGRFEVFRDRAEAEVWLLTQATSPPE